MTSLAAAVVSVFCRGLRCKRLCHLHVLTPARLWLTAMCACLTLAAWAQGADSMYVFRFVPCNDMFYVPYGPNGQELQRLSDSIAAHLPDIQQGRCIFYVDGYCGRSRSGTRPLQVARVRSNRVKSELIVRHALTEHHFITHNHATGPDCVEVRMAMTTRAVPVTTYPEDTVTTTVVAVPSAAVQPAACMPVVQEPPAEPFAMRSGPVRLVLRANLLRWATLTPHLGVECRFGSRWSAMVQGTCTSWSWRHKERRYALWEVAPEVRCHIYNKVYVGAQFKAGSFNYKLGGKGRQGDLMGGGLTLGCVLPMGRHCAVDLGMALGGLHASYDVYTVAGRHRIRTGSVSKNWWGPTDVGLTLVYNLK